jgi:O-antigen/teichoic acid export membrane protein
MQSRFSRNVSANTLQLIVNQVFGLAIFIALSGGLDKNIFGQINWSLAVLLTVFGILGFGIDQVMVKKIAAGYEQSTLFSAYFFHVLFSGTLFYGLLLAFYLIFPGLIKDQIFLLFIGFGKLGIFLSTPFKQLAAGLEKFTVLFLMSIISNVIRGTGLLILLFIHQMFVPQVLAIFIIGDLTELVFCVLMSGKLTKARLSIRWNKRHHIQLIRESLPQTGTIIFTAIISRFDWILIGLLLSDIKLAEYSFAYKIFEVSNFPLLIIAPIMIPLFSRLQKQSEDIRGLSFFLEWQIIIASFVALLMNISWIPVIDLISNGKYGAVNSGTIFLLSFSMPFLYITNYLWTIQFTHGNLKLIFRVMAFALLTNITCCSILVPFFKNEGAAIACLATVLAQLILYIRKKTLAIPLNQWWFLLCWPITALFCGLIAHRYQSYPVFSIFLAAAAYSAVVIISRQVRRKDWKILQSLYQ